jgi:hypothetical protein
VRLLRKPHSISGIGVKLGKLHIPVKTRLKLRSFPKRNLSDHKIKADSNEAGQCMAVFPDILARRRANQLVVSDVQRPGFVSLRLQPESEFFPRPVARHPILPARGVT